MTDCMLVTVISMVYVASVRRKLLSSQFVRPIGTRRIIRSVCGACPAPYPARSTLHTTNLDSFRMPPHLSAHNATHAPSDHASPFVVHCAPYPGFV